MADVSYINNFTITNSVKKNRHQFRILIVDDDKDMANAFGEILKDRGHNVTISNEGISCVGKCQNYHYDIIFMDFHMTSMNGVDTTDLLRNICHNNSIIFAFTGDDSQPALIKFKDIGMNGAIIKPLDIDLINKLMNTLELNNTSELNNSINKQIIKNFKRHLFIF